MTQDHLPVPSSGKISFSKKLAHVLNKTHDHHDGRTGKPYQKHPNHKVREKCKHEHATILAPQIRDRGVGEDKKTRHPSCFFPVDWDGQGHFVLDAGGTLHLQCEARGHLPTCWQL
jgi:hypothetical protein